MLTEGRLVVGGGWIGGGAVQEMMHSQGTCMQRRWCSRWCRRRLDELRQRDRRRRRATASLGQARGRGEIQQQKGKSTEPGRKSRRTARSTSPFTSAGGDLPEPLEHSGGCFPPAGCQRAPAGEWEGEKKQMRGGGGFQRGFPGLYSEGGELGLGWLRRKRLGAMGGFWGWRSALSAGVGVVVSVAARSGRKLAGFSNVADKMVRGGGTSVRCGAGQGWRRVRGSMPCKRVSRVRLDGARVHGNALPALDALGGQFAPCWHGRGVVYGGSEVAASRGIGRGRAGELDGEVTGREVVGGALPRSGTLGGHGDCPGRRGVAGSGLCSVGSS
jgi:hypothetical protein